MIPLSTLLIIYSILLFQQVSAFIERRIFSGCAALNTNIYCYGGYLGAQGGQFINAVTDHYTVDLSTANMNIKNPKLNWTTVNPAAANQTPVLEARANFPITSIDQTRYVILGGALTNVSLNNPAILYDSTKNAWQALAVPPFYMSNGAMVSSDPSTVWSYGGTLNSTSDITPPITLRLDLTSIPGTWTSFANSGLSPPNTRHGHAAVIRGSSIYYIGGFFATSATQSTPVPMNQVSFYNTDSDLWGRIDCNGANPKNRTYHTATLIANSSKVLIYGGTGSDVAQHFPLLDYAYTWDLNTKEYVELNLTLGAGPRVGHSAVQYQGTILISFGLDTSGNLRNDTSILDVSDPTKPVWMGSQPSSTSPVTPGGSNNNTGAIAGGVVGGVAGVAIIAGALFYYHRRKKNQLDRNDFDLYQPPQGFHTDDSPTLFTSSDGHRYSDADNNNSNNIATAAAHESTKKDNGSSSPLEMYSTDPAPNYQQIKPDESDEPLSRMKPSGND